MWDEISFFQSANKTSHRNVIYKRKECNSIAMLTCHNIYAKMWQHLLRIRLISQDVTLGNFYTQSSKQFHYRYVMPHHYYYHN